MKPWEKVGMTEQQFRELQRKAQLEMCRRDFWEYCKIIAPDFYMEGRDYLKRLCKELQEFYNAPEERVMVINAPPRHGKSRTLQLFSEWVLGVDPSRKIITGSYNEQLSKTFSRNVRDVIMEKKAEKNRIVYSDIFPRSKIKKGSSAASLWALQGQHVSFLATSPGGTVTGFGANLLLLDDTLKNAEEAMNENILEQQWTWFTNTLLSRFEKGGKLVVLMTRWNTKDLSGRVLEHYQAIGVPVRQILYTALQEDGTMLCDDVLDRAAYDLIVKTMGKEIVESNYNQKPINLVGRLYDIGFDTYKSLPVDANGNSVVEEICAYVDTADQGSDYLCGIIYAVYNHMAYVLDVYYTQDNMSITEPEMAKRLSEYKVTRAYIESNNGGRGWGRSVERIMREKHHYYSCYTDLFTQHKNKRARILSNATNAQRQIKFPIAWDVKYPQFYLDTLAYQKEGKMAHDDNADAITGVVERLGRSLFSFD